MESLIIMIVSIVTLGFVGIISVFKFDQKMATQTNQSL